MVDLIKMTCKNNELPSTTEDISIIIYILFSTPRICISFNPYFSHVLSPLVCIM
jgi:hypothetical protein